MFIESHNIVLDFLGYARSAQQNIGASVASARSAHLISAKSEKNMPGGRTRVITRSRGTSRLLNTLEGGLCERSTKKHSC
jgi:hypothetical protein